MASTSTRAAPPTSSRFASMTSANPRPARRPQRKRAERTKRGSLEPRRRPHANPAGRRPSLAQPTARRRLLRGAGGGAARRGPRAGIEQMVAWADRAGVPHLAGSSGADPASVVFDGVQTARKRGNDVVIVDTAGRLQTQRNLLEELAKVGRVTSKALDDAPYESLLVLDAVLGLTNLVQAREFNKAIPITGLALSKLDSTAKGGAAISIESELDVPVKLAGVGESIEDIAEFDPQAFIRAIFES